MYYLFLDESGDHNYKHITLEPIFVLAGCIFSNKPENLYYLHSVTRMHKLKEDLFNNFYIIFHTRDITNNTKGFEKVREPNFRKLFFYSCNKLIEDCKFKLISSIIHKKDLLEQYGKRAKDPYYYSFDRILERFALFLNHAIGEKKGIIFYESRRKDLDRNLEANFKYIMDNGTINLTSDFINNKIVKLVKLNKDCNISGLQFADLCATPISRKERGLKDSFIKYNTIEKKFRRGPGGKVKGYGKIIIKK